MNDELELRVAARIYPERQFLRQAAYGVA